MPVLEEMSYDYANPKRDLLDAFLAIVQSKPVLRSLIGELGFVATATKHEWLEDVVSPKGWTVNGTRSIAGASLTVVSTTGMKVGMVLGFQTAAGISKTVQLIVTSITSGTVVAVSVYGGTTDVALAATDLTFLVGTPKGESTSAIPDDGTEPSDIFNFTQIFDRTAKVSGTAQATNKYGLPNTIEYQIQRHLKDLAYELNTAMIHGTRVQRTGTAAGTTGSMGGILYYLENGTGNKVDAASATITQDILNNAFELGVQNGADNLKTLLCNTDIARAISAMNASGNNPIVQRDDTRTGNYVMDFVSDLPIAGGLISRIIVEPAFPRDKVALLDTSKIGLLALQNRSFRSFDAKGSDADDFIAERVIGEYTMEMKNASESHVLIENLLP